MDLHGKKNMVVFGFDFSSNPLISMSLVHLIFHFHVMSVLPFFLIASWTSNGSFVGPVRWRSNDVHVHMDQISCRISHEIFACGSMPLGRLKHRLAETHQFLSVLLDGITLSFVHVTWHSENCFLFIYFPLMDFSSQKQWCFQCQSRILRAFISHSSHHPFFAGFSMISAGFHFIKSRNHLKSAFLWAPGPRCFHVFFFLTGHWESLVAIFATGFTGSLWAWAASWPSKWRRSGRNEWWGSTTGQAGTKITGWNPDRKWWLMMVD